MNNILEFVNINNEAVAFGKQDALEWEQARQEGINALIQSRQRRKERQKAYRYNRTMGLLCAIGGMIASVTLMCIMAIFVLICK